MGKLLLLILFAVLAYMYLTRPRRPSPPTHAAAPKSAEPMVRCARCGVHVPLGESVAVGEKRYCSEEHRRLG